MTYRGGLRAGGLSIGGVGRFRRRLAGGGGGLPAENGAVVSNVFSGSNTSGIQTLFASQEAEPAWQALDGDPVTRWRAFSPPQQFGINFGKPEVIYSIAILGAASHPTDFLVQSSIDGVTWETRLVVSGVLITFGEYENFPLTTPFEAQWWRLDISATSGSGTRIFDIKWKS